MRKGKRLDWLLLTKRPQNIIKNATGGLVMDIAMCGLA
jgi:hypothetical protein